jgi:hypothetical protein
MKVSALLFITTLAIGGLGCSSGDESTNRTAARPAPPDTEIQATVEKTLASKGLRNVRGQSVEGTVLLTGYVESEEEKKSVEEVIKSLPGVVSVDNRTIVLNEMAAPALGAPAAVPLDKSVNTNRPGGPRKERTNAVNSNKPGGPRKGRNP